MDQELIYRIKELKKVLLIGFFVLSGIICFGIIIYGIGFTESKVPVTSEHMWDVLVLHGFEPYDLTESYDQSDNIAINKCIVVEREDTHFEFYDYIDETSALNKSVQACSYIISYKRSFPYIEHNTKVRNYNVYTLSSNGEYSVSIRVENTTIYAYCNEENKGLLIDILNEIGYL